jgi:hypothetical protein
VIGADPHRATKVLAKVDQGRELLADALQLRLVLDVAVLSDLELLFVGVVAGVHPDFFHPLGGFEGGVRLEMDVRHQRHLAAGGAHLAGDVLQIRRINLLLRRDPDNFATGIRECQDLRDTGGRVAGVGSDHRLHADRVVAADADVSDPHLAGGSAVVV